MAKKMKKPRSRAVKTARMPRTARTEQRQALHALIKKRAPALKELEKH